MINTITLFILASLSLSAFASKDNYTLSHLDIGSKIIFNKNIPIRIPVAHFIQNGQMLLQHKVDPKMPYCRFQPNRETTIIKSGDVVTIRNIKGATSRIRYQRPFYTSFEILSSKLISEFRCINGTKNSEVTIGELKVITQSLMSFDFKFQEIIEDRSGTKIIKLPSKNKFLFNYKLGFFENSFLYFQNGKQIYQDEVDKDDFYCMLASMPNTVIHPNDTFSIKEIKTTYNTTRILNDNYHSTISLMEIDINISCLNANTQQHATAEELEYHLGGLLEIIP